RRYPNTLACAVRPPVRATFHSAARSFAFPYAVIDGEGNAGVTADSLSSDPVGHFPRHVECPGRPHNLASGVDRMGRVGHDHGDLHFVVSCSSAARAALARLLAYPRTSPAYFRNSARPAPSAIVRSDFSASRNASASRSARAFCRSRSMPICTEALANDEIRSTSTSARSASVALDTQARAFQSARKSLSV